jgi:hypothetical protein
MLLLDMDLASMKLQSHDVLVIIQSRDHKMGRELNLAFLSNILTKELN